MNLEKLLNGINILAVVCNQWGDTGKGKFTELFANDWADITARGTGGDNAGHTTVVNGVERIYHLLPSGIGQDSNKKINILGNGMVINPFVLCRELDKLTKQGGTYNHLKISESAHVILPHHIKEDQARYASLEGGGIGSTGRGIGPCYEDKIARRGITMGDLKDKTLLSRKLDAVLGFYHRYELQTRTMTHRDINSERDQIIESLEQVTERLSQFITDTRQIIHDYKKQGKKILIEGAQGLLLSIEHGTYPYLTSSDCSINGTAGGVGISAGAVDLTLGIVKFPFMTRVGGGPFPTEFGTDSEEYCAKGLEHDVFYEAATHLGMPLKLDEIRALQSQKSPESQAKLAEQKQEVHRFIKANKQKVLGLCNSNEPFEQGKGIRLAALEYGATTARPRRTGWTDAVAAKYATQINAPMKLILTKADCLAGVNRFSICYEYQNGNQTTNFRPDEKFLRGAKPRLTTYRGYGNIQDLTAYDKLPNGLKGAIEHFETFVGAEVAAVSVGPERDQTIVR